MNKALIGAAQLVLPEMATIFGQTRKRRREVSTVLSTIPLEQAALFLDLDGTLAPIAERPELVGPDRARNRLLRNVHRALGGRLAVISGRPIDDVDRVLETCVPLVAGVHGLERRDMLGVVRSAAPHPQLDNVYTQLEAFVRDRPGLHLEFKMLGVALHYRQGPQYGLEALEFARRLAWMTGMKLQEGRMVAELRTPGSDKGQTIRDYMAEPPFFGATPVFVGDDITDEDGFVVAQELGGFGVLVGAGRETQAVGRLASVGHVLSWLDEAISTEGFSVLS